MNQRVERREAQPEDTFQLLNPVFIGALLVFLGLWLLIGYFTFF